VAYGIYALVYGAALLAALAATTTPSPRRILGALLATGLIAFAGLRGFSIDYEGYEVLYELMVELDLDYPERWFVGKDFLFGGLIDGLQRLGAPAQALIFVSAVLGIALKQLAFSRVLGGNTAVAWLVTLCLSFFLHEFTQIRTAIALGFCFLAFHHLQQGHLKLWLWLTFLAAGFHISAAVFVPVAAIVLVKPGWRVQAWALMTVTVTLALMVVYGFLGTIDPRLESHGDIVGLNLTAVAVGLFKLTLLVPMAHAAATALPARLAMLRSMVWPCVMFIATGIVMLVLLRNVASALAFRLYEFFDAFAVFVIVAALLQPRAAPKLLAVGYCAFALLLQALPGLFTPYVFVPPWRVWGG
jgi:hypothetical protein